MSCKGVNTWKVVEKEYSPQNALMYESLFSLGNGYMGCRGFHPDEVKESYEIMTFVAGVFDFIKPGITDFVNMPNLFHIRLFIDGLQINPLECKIMDYTRELDLKTGVLYRSFIVRDQNDRETLVEYNRFFSLAEKHLVVSKYKVTPLNYSGNISILAAIDAGTTNNPVPDDQMKSDNDVISLYGIEKIDHYSQNAVYVGLSTKSKNIQMAEALSIVCSGPKSEYGEVYSNKIIGIKSSNSIKTGTAIEFDIFTTVYTSRDGLGEIEQAAKRLAKEAAVKGYQKALEDNSAAWAMKWEICDIRIDGDDLLQQGLRYNMFQLISSNAQDDGRVSIGARGLTHSRYKGCYFWDTEIFMLPFFIYTSPDAARNLLMYRYNTLGAAEQLAKSQNVMGSRYPWMCNTDGVEQCETWDIGFSEVHITADIAYAIDNYIRTTGDTDFYLDFGAEMLIKTASYWVSRFTYDEKNDIYNMLNVKGPNEYGGVTLNNTYTTLMALHNLELGKKAIESLKAARAEQWLDLKDQMGFDENELVKWNDIIAKAKVNYDKERSLYIEDDNFFKLEPLDVKALKKGEEPLYKTICFDRLQRYRVIKQADVILLMCLFPDRFSEQEMKAAWDEYEPVTLHDSSLSYGTHAQLASWLGINNKAYDYLMKGIRLDIDNIMNNTGKEGIHFASIGAAWQAFVFGLCGVHIGEEGIVLRPNLPEHINKVELKLIYKGSKYKIEIDNCGKTYKSFITIVD